MTRRNIFRAFTACIVASAMDVFAVRPKGILDLIAEEFVRREIELSCYWNGMDVVSLEDQA